MSVHLQFPLSLLKSFLHIWQPLKLSREEGPLLLLQQKSRMPLAGLVYLSVTLVT